MYWGRRCWTRASSSTNLAACLVMFSSACCNARRRTKAIFFTDSIDWITPTLLSQRSWACQQVRDEAWSAQAQLGHFRRYADEPGRRESEGCRVLAHDLPSDARGRFVGLEPTGAGKDFRAAVIMSNTGPKRGLQVRTPVESITTEIAQHGKWKMEHGEWGMRESHHVTERPCAPKRPLGNIVSCPPRPGSARGRRT